MKVIIKDTYEEMSKACAEIFINAINENPEIILGLATGGTPVGAYAEMVKANEEGRVDFSKVRSYNLDEYCGMSYDHDQSYHYFMNDNLFDHVNIDKANTHVPEGLAEDLEKACKDYDAEIEAAGGVDLQLLGIGPNGHIGFNEPAPEFSEGTNIVTLKESTRQANARFFNSIDEVPTKAITMGIGTIMNAKKVVLVANGTGKAPVIKAAIEGPVTPEVPASILQNHPDCIFVLDSEAASLLENK